MVIIFCTAATGFISDQGFGGSFSWLLLIQWVVPLVRPCSNDPDDSGFFDVVNLQKDQSECCMPYFALCGLSVKDA